MNGTERREQILSILKNSEKPVPGVELARILHVSRQVIVQDMALLRANGVEILSTNRGYVTAEEHSCSRVFKVIHTEKQVEEELNLYVDFGGKVEDVFVYHKVYGVIRADMNIKSRMDVKRYLQDISEGKSTQLMKLTSNYHYHTISAEREEILDMIQEHSCSRVFKVIHTEKQVEEELNLYVDFGGKVEDVFVYHKVYGVIRADMNIKSRMDVKRYLQDISEGKSTQLMKLTSNYHYHTISAEREEILDMIQEELEKRGFLAKLQDYEPVDFWETSEEA